MPILISHVKLNVLCLNRKAAGVRHLLAGLHRTNKYLAISGHTFHQGSLRYVVRKNEK